MRDADFELPELSEEELGEVSGGAGVRMDPNG